jgi:tetratricopeptide (TPR) repeat protein
VGRSTDALGAFERALELEPRYAAAWVRKGALLNSLGQRQDGLEAVERALELARQKGNVLLERRAAERLAALGHTI